MKRGFTLMELLIVIALIGILVTMGVASYSTAQVKSRDARRKADMKVYQNAFEQYYADHSGAYTETGQVSDLIDGGYLPGGAPTDPKPTGHPQYEVTINAAGPVYYCACANMEGGLGNSNEQCTNMGSCAGTCDYYCVRNLQ